MADAERTEYEHSHKASLALSIIATKRYHGYNPTHHCFGFLGHEREQRLDNDVCQEGRDLNTVHQPHPPEGRQLTFHKITH